MATLVHFALFHCIETEDAGADECILRFDGNEFWRGAMKGGRTRNTDTQMVLNSQEAMVTLTDEDSPDEDDYLGGQIIRKEEAGLGWRRAYFQADEADYWIDYNVFNT